VLIFSVAIASVEIVFSTINYVKNKQRNKMGGEYLNNCLVTFIEKELFSQVKNEDIINLFQKGIVELYCSGLSGTMFRTCTLIIIMDLFWPL
jgi:hypothetical protein